jgi:transcriptional regulator NrdR family protein
MTKFTHIIKRDGSVVPFTPERIANAIYRAAVAVGGRDRSTSEALAAEVVSQLEQTTPKVRCQILNKSKTW